MSSHLASGDKTERVIANLLVASNGATTKLGRSAPMSPPSDRKRFHALRSRARAIVIGGNTFRKEPYSQCALPLYVATSQSEGQILDETTVNPLRRLLNVAPDDIVDVALAEQGAPILVEGGARFLHPLIEKSLIDTFYITRITEDGDGNFFDERHLSKTYRLEYSEIEDGATFEIWKPLNFQEN
jgi:riboflavin biosynthesis pyrimidine reductase